MKNVLPNLKTNANSLNMPFAFSLATQAANISESSAFSYDAKSQMNLHKHNGLNTNGRKTEFQSSYGNDGSTVWDVKEDN